MAIDIPNLQKRSSKISEHTALVLALFSTISAAGMLFLSTYINSYGLLASGFICLTTAVTSFFACLHAYIERAAAEEILSNHSLPREDGTLFEEQLAEQGDRSQVWLQFEKWFLPLFTLALILAETGAAIYLASRLDFIKPATPSPVESTNFSYGLIIIWGTAVFLLFIIGKYAAGLAYHGHRRHLRAPASLSIFSAFFLLLTIAIFLLANFAIKSENQTITNPDPPLLYAGIIIFAIFAIDHLAGFVFSFYRPRTSPEESLPLYENHLAALFSQPEGLWQGIAEIIDYQFGFKLSETHFYNFFLKALLPLLGFQLISLMLLSCIAVIPAGKQGLIERFGQKIGEPLNPGLHVKLPWPIERIFQCPSQLIHSVNFGEFSKKQTKAKPRDNYGATSLIRINCILQPMQDSITIHSPLLSLTPTPLSILSQLQVNSNMQLPIPNNTIIPPPILKLLSQNLLNVS